MVGSTASSLEQQVTAFVSEQCDVPSTQLSSQTRLVEDLQLVGDDAFEFIEAYAERFSVEAGDFSFEKFFPVEGFNPLAVIADIFRKPKQLAPITIGMLVKAAAAGRWEQSPD